MARGAFLVPILALCACSEYDIIGDQTVFGQPNPPDLSAPVQTDRIVQVTVASVDVLWIIDTSGSMSEEQDQLVANFDQFMLYFIDSGLDYHIGVVSTNMDDAAKSGKLQPDPGTGVRIIDTTTIDPVGVFGRMADMGIDSHYNEMGRSAGYTAIELRRFTDNAGFYREDANLALVVISDEDDYSYTTPITQQNWITYLQTLKPIPEMVTFSSIVGEEGGSYYGTCPTAYEPGSLYLEVTRAVGGIEWSVCSDDYAVALEQLGMQAAGLRREFFLSQVPVEETIGVWVEQDGAPIEVGGEPVEFAMGVDYTYERTRNSIRFATFVPEPLSEVFIQYEILAAPN